MSEGKDDGALSAQKQRPVFPLVGHLSREPRLAGKVCVVSGASRGFGAAIAIRFVEEGAKVVCLSRGGCDETLELIGQIDGVEAADVPKLAISVQCDISSEVRQNLLLGLPHLLLPAPSYPEASSIPRGDGVPCHVLPCCSPPTL